MTSPVCSVPQNSTRSRTTGALKRPQSSRSGVFPPTHETTSFLTILLQFVPPGLGDTPLFVADHYFIANTTGTGISPKFASARDGGASFIVAAKAASIPAPDRTNVDWLQLVAVQGMARSSALLPLWLGSELNILRICRGLCQDCLPCGYESWSTSCIGQSLPLAGACSTQLMYLRVVYTWFGSHQCPVHCKVLCAAL
jgi:hypothetical protein